MTDDSGNETTKILLFCSVGWRRPNKIQAVFIGSYPCLDFLEIFDWTTSMFRRPAGIQLRTLSGFPLLGRLAAGWHHAR